MQHKKILERSLPDTLKLSIAKKIENNLFSKVIQSTRRFSLVTFALTLFQMQITFLSGLKAMGEIRALFAAEVSLNMFSQNI
jgi:hypothetical protein